MAMAMEAAELWMTAVKSAATRATSATPPRDEASILVNAAWIEGFWRMGNTPFDMKYMPRNTRPKPRMARPRLCGRSPRRKKYIMPPSPSPTRPSICGSGANATIHTVAVVPTFAPMITLIACWSDISPDETNPTSMTVMMEDDCTRMVETMPVPTPAARCVVAKAMNLRSSRPATACKPSERCFMPRRNTPRPPSTVTRTRKMSFMCGEYYTKSSPVARHAC